MKLLLQHKLITKSQLNRVLEASLGRSEKRLHEEIVARRLVDPVMMKKIVDAITVQKGLVFPFLCDDIGGVDLKGKKVSAQALAPKAAAPAAPTA